MEKVLITGATGFVGSNIARRLLHEGYDVHIISRNSSNTWRLNDIYTQINDHKVDLLDIELLKETVKSINPDHIIHLAIYGGRPGQSEDMKILNSNLIGTINLVEASKDINYKSFINTGSSSEYGSKDSPMKEDDICSPDNMYGVTKASASMFCNLKSKLYNKNIGTLRLFSPFGDYEDIGRLIPDLVIGSLKDKYVRLANPNAVRDYIYIEDVCDIYLKVLKEPNLLKGQVFNIGYGKQHSVKYMADTVKSLLTEDIKFEYNSIEGRKEDSDIWVSDIEKVKIAYNWEPKNSMKDGLKKTILWFRQNISLYNGGK